MTPRRKLSFDDIVFEDEDVLLDLDSEDEAAESECELMNEEEWLL